MKLNPIQLVKEEIKNIIEKAMAAQGLDGLELRLSWKSPKTQATGILPPTSPCVWQSLQKRHPV